MRIPVSVHYIKNSGNLAGHQAFPNAMQKQSQLMTVILIFNFLFLRGPGFRIFWLFWRVTNATLSRFPKFFLEAQVQSVDPEKEDVYLEGLLMANWLKNFKREPSSHRGLSHKPLFREKSALSCLPPALNCLPALCSHHLSQPLERSSWNPISMDRMETFPI